MYYKKEINEFLNQKGTFSLNSFNSEKEKDMFCKLADTVCSIIGGCDEFNGEVNGFEWEVDNLSVVADVYMYIFKDIIHPVIAEYETIIQNLKAEPKPTITLSNQEMLDKIELFLIDNLKELPTGNGGNKIKADCSLEDFIGKMKESLI